MTIKKTLLSLFALTFIISAPAIAEHYVHKKPVYFATDYK